MVRLGLAALALSYVLFLGAYFGAFALGLGRSGWLGLVRELTLYLFAPVPLLLLGALALRAWTALGLALVPVAIFAVVYAPRFLPAEAPQVVGPTLRVLSFNSGGNVGGGQPETLLQTVRAVDADVLALQEVPAATLPVLREALAAVYPYQVGAEDAPILSRWPLEPQERFELRDSGYDVERAVVEVGGRRLMLTNVHVTRPGYRVQWRRGVVPLVRGYNPAWRDAEVAELVQRLREVAGPQVLTGDFNETEWSHPYELLTEMLEDSFRDAGRGFGHTYPSQLTWRSWRIAVPLVRIDYIFHSAELAALRAWVGPHGGSDHLPVVAELAFR
jgi:vancomycin resistance protein VanJ